MDVFLIRLASVVFAAVICVYVGYQIYQTTYTSVEVTNAVSYTVYDTIDTTAFVVRDETVIHTATDGYVYYTLQNGDRVAKNGRIAQIFPSEADALIQQKIHQLNDQIHTLQAIETQGDYNRTNLDLINSQLASDLQSLALSTLSNRYSSLQDVQFKLLQSFCKQQLTIGTLSSLKSKIDELTAQKRGLSENYSPATSTISSPVAGYFISQTDGMEDVFDYHAVVSVLPHDVQKAIEGNVTTSSTESVGKVAGDYQWYMLCVLNNEQTAGIGVGKSMSVRLPFVSSDSLPVKVVAVNKDRDGRAAVVLQCITMSEKLASIRRETLQIQLSSYTGLYVQDSALHFNSNNEPGVFVRIGNTCAFRKVDILYHSESGKYSICTMKDDKEYLQLYDDIIVKGKGLYDGRIIR